MYKHNDWIIKIIIYFTDLLLFDVLFLFVLESKECSLAVCRTILAQTRATWFQHCCFEGKVKCATLLLEYRRGAHLPSKGREPVGGSTTIGSLPKKPGCKAQRHISAETIADWSDPGQLNFLFMSHLCMVGVRWEGGKWQGALCYSWYLRR